jgi:hypothetical protein
VAVEPYREERLVMHSVHSGEDAGRPGTGQGLTGSCSAADVLCMSGMYASMTAQEVALIPDTSNPNPRYTKP